MHNKNMIVLVGQTCSGKTTIAKELEHLGYNRVVTYTTRKPRHYEVEGIDYHFVSDEVFKKMLKDGKLAEYAEYDAKFGHVYYGSAKEDYYNIKKSVIVLNPEGLQMIKDNHIPHFSVLLDISDEEIIKRTTARGDKEDEVIRRLKTDNPKFDGIREKVDLILTEDTTKNLINKILSF